jgi:hypothetical protein
MPPLFLTPDEKIQHFIPEIYRSKSAAPERKYWIFLELNRRQVLESILLQLFLPSADESFLF